MERLQQLLLQIQSQLKVLTISQRVSIGLCVVMIVGSLMWLTQWSTAPELVPLVGNDFSYEELNTAEESLRASGMPYEIRGTRIYVREVDRSNLKRILYSSQALPQDRLFDMESVVNDPNPFQSPEARTYAQNYAKGNELAKIIETYPSVRKASVLINPSSKRRVGGESDIPTASVSITLAPSKEMTAELVEGFAKLVSGAVAGLKPHNVNISDTRTGETYNVPRPEEAISFGYLREQQKHEAYLLQKIKGKLGEIPNVRVAVTVELDTTKKTRQSTKYESGAIRTEATQSSEQGNTEEAGETGTQPNLGAAVTEGGSSSQKSTTEETTTDYFEPKLSETETVEQPAMAVKRTTAAVSLPRSFLVGIYQAKFPNTEAPKDDDQKFATIRDEEVARVKTSVEKIVMAKTANDVQVDVYPDVTWGQGGGAFSPVPTEITTAAQAESLDPMGLAKTYGPQTGLALLAITAMFMMMRIARRQTENLAPAPLLKEETLEEEPILTARSHPVGQAEVSESLLVGREVDDLTLRYEEIGTEVSRMVEADPEGAADLIRRWCQEVN